MYEIHLTVKDANIEQFTNDCEQIGIKPILIDTGTTLNQLMTSSKYKNNNYKKTLNELKEKLIKKGYKVVRDKVEIYPEEIKNSDHKYYESHIRLKLNKGYNLQHLRTICLINEFHISKNLFKKDENYDYQMITYRNGNINLHDFKNHIEIMTNILDKFDILYDKIEIEECVYDSNIGIDKDWIK